MVGLADDGETLSFALAPGGTPFASFLPNTAQDAEAELCEQGRTLAAEIGGRVARDGGWALIVDYGYDASRPGSSLQAVRGHHGAAVLDRPGQTDLSAHVDFGALAASVAAASQARVFGPVGQGDFLKRLGILHRAETLRARASPAQRHAIDASLERLIAPDQMGTLFRVMAVGDDRSATPAGFSDGT
jgi:NADH dehydrogenase [ubiquinone] 1 alpha subcomplex assembly factor 7